MRCRIDEIESKQTTKCELNENDDRGDPEKEDSRFQLRPLTFAFSDSSAIASRAFSVTSEILSFTNP